MQKGYFGANADEIAALAASSNAPSRAVCAIEPARPPRNRSVGALNLSTHTAAALYATFPPAEARRVLKRLEFHFTPKHASWLNMVEIEIGSKANVSIAASRAAIASLPRSTPGRSS